MADLAAGAFLDAETGSAVGVDIATVADRAELGGLGAIQAERGPDRGERAACEGFQDATPGLPRADELGEGIDARRVHSSSLQSRFDCS